MDIVGALGFPVPRTQPILEQPRPQSRIAEGLLETILVEVTRPAPEAFTVRIFDEDIAPPVADVVSVFVFHGVPVNTVARQLESSWRVMKLVPEPGVRYAAFVTYVHPNGYFAVIQSIEALQSSYPP